MQNRGQKLRWMILFASFLVLVYGGRFLTLNAQYVKLPVFACPYNTNAAIQGSCLYITEWKDYLLEGFSSARIGSTILIFSGTAAAILLFGKLWCGYVCPFGFIQDVLYKIRELFGVRKRNIGAKMRERIKLVKWALMTIFLIGIGFCELCPVRFVIPPLNGIVTGFEPGIVVAVVVLALSFNTERFFCRICPLGGMIGLFHKWVPFKIMKDCVACTECGICYEACPMDIRDIYTEREDADVTRADCIFCNKCIDSCPEKDALSLSFKGKKVYSSSRERFYKNHLK